MKIEISPKEMIDFIEEYADVPEIKEKLSGIFVSMVHSPEVEEAMNKRINERVKAQMESAVKGALYEKEGSWGKPRTIEGWAAELLKKEVADKVKKVDVTELIRRLVYERVEEEIQRITRTNERMVAEHKQLINEEVKRLIPLYVTEEYRNRVADHFEKNKLEDQITDLVQKAFGRMLLSGMGK